jgi:hypothetical protein
MRGSEGAGDEVSGIEEIKWGQSKLEGWDGPGRGRAWTEERQVKAESRRRVQGKRRYAICRRTDEVIVGREHSDVGAKGLEKWRYLGITPVARGLPRVRLKLDVGIRVGSEPVWRRERGNDVAALTPLTRARSDAIVQEDLMKAVRKLNDAKKHETTM